MIKLFLKAKNYIIVYFATLLYIFDLGLIIIIYSI